MVNEMTSFRAGIAADRTAIGIGIEIEIEIEIEIPV